MPVFFSYLTFGIGIVPTLIGVTVVDLPVKGASGHPLETFHDWRTPATAGHYCLQVGLFWGDDAEPDNNLGQENVDVGKLSLTGNVPFSAAQRCADDAPLSPRGRHLPASGRPALSGFA